MRPFGRSDGRFCARPRLLVLLRRSERAVPPKGRPPIQREDVRAGSGAAGSGVVASREPWELKPLVIS